MKTLAILFTLFYFLNALAVAPYGFKGQNQSQTLYSNVLQAPNQLVTNLGGINSLMETGNKNILANPSFEAPLVSFAAPSWSSLGFLTNNITPPVSGQKAVQVSMTASALSLHQDSGVNNAAYGDGLQCLASVYVKTTLSGIFVSPRLNNVTSTTNMVSVVPNGKWALYKVPFICSTGANGIAIHSNSVAVTGTVDVDDAFVGAVDLKVDVPTANFQSSYISQLASFGISTITGALTESKGSGNFSYNSATGIYTVLKRSQFTVSASFRGSASVAVQPIISGSSYVDASVEQSVSTANPWTSTSFSFIGEIGATIFVRNGANTTDAQRISITSEEISSTSVYSSNNADTDWASCGLTGAAFTGFGSSVPTPELQCKRQGADLLIKGKFTAGTTPTAVEARMALPTWNGVQLVSAGSSVIPSVQLAGPAVINFASTTYFGFNVLIEPSVAYTTFSLQTSSANGITKQTGAAIALSGQVMSINARIPIEGWQGSNIIVGSFNGLQNCTSTLACTDNFSAYIDSTPSVITQNAPWVTSVTGTTTKTINVATGVFTVLPACTCTVIAGAGIVDRSCVFDAVASTVNSIVVATTANGAASNASLTISCPRQGADYVGKTALAVASDQNIRTPGVAKAVVYSAYIGAAGTVVSEIGNLMNGNCTVASTNVFTCTFTSGIFASDPVCNLTVMGVSGASRSAYIVTSPSTTGVTFLTYNTTGPTAAALNTQITCHGVSP